jgi:hypothetical protein
MDYRSERLRQETDLIESNYGYATEIADDLRIRAENGTPLIDFRTWLKGHRNLPPEEPVTAPVVEMEYGNKLAEETLLAVAMREPSVVWMINDIGPQAFLASPLNSLIAEAIINLERDGIRAHWGNVETYLEKHHIPPIYENGTKYGLRHWHDHAGPAIFAQGAADDVRLHYTAYQAERVLTWGTTMMRKHIMEGPTSQGIKDIHSQIQQQMEDLGVTPQAPEPIMGLTPRSQALLRPRPLASTRKRT